MSKNEEKTSDAALEQDAASSVFDFLYYDARRIGSYLAQFDPSGHLQAYKQSESVGSSATSVSRIGGRGTVGVASFDSGKDASETETEGEASERQYDPLWTNALNFLDYLDNRRLLRRELAGSRISQFVLAKGELNVVDLTLVKRMWDLPTIGQLGGEVQSSESNRHERRAKQRVAPPNTRPTEQQVGFDLLKVIPHSIQASIVSDQGSVWSTLREDSLIVAASDLFLKHGKTIPGQWHMLGIVDALPTEELAPEPPTPEQSAIGILGGLGYILDAIGPFARLLLGRPASAYGMTPLLIFRKVES